MNPGDITLIPIRQSDGQIKKRPVLLLKQMPPFNDWLVAGISTQLHQEAKGFDMTILEDDPIYAQSRLKGSSLIRLGFLDVVTASEIKGSTGSIPEEKVKTLLNRLASHLTT